jgi:Protein of unknown function (DUF4254)
LKEIGTMHSADYCYSIFQKSIDDYHLQDNVDAISNNPYTANSFEYLLYLKNWIDTVQWHLEDLIRVPAIDPREALLLKRRIDKSNQERTDTVERMDDYFVQWFNQSPPAPGARLNSETPAWLLDRMSILLLKIYHMKEQVERTDASDEHRAKCRIKLDVLLEQKTDMALAFNQLIKDVGDGIRRIKVYRQMKMYNDESLNPSLYGNKK